MTQRRHENVGFLGASTLLFGLGVAVTIGWCASMSGMAGMSMAGGWTLSMVWMPMGDQSWLGVAASFVGMWVVMMVAMMVPSLVPMLRRYRAAVGQYGPVRLGLLTVLVGLGYFAVWVGWGVAVFLVGAGLAAAEMRSPALASAVPLLSGMVVMVAGAVQYTRWKARQLACCREKGACARVARADVGGAWRRGVDLGLRCSACCAGTTAVLLAVGVMDLRVMGVVTAAITLERFAPRGERMARAIGAVAVTAGVFMMVRAVAAG